MKRIISLLIVLVVLIVLSTCTLVDELVSYNIKYVISGTAIAAYNIIYINETQGITKLNDITLPWSTTIVLNKDEVASVGAFFIGNGNITASIFVNGILVDTQYTNIEFTAITAQYILN